MWPARAAVPSRVLRLDDLNSRVAVIECARRGGGHLAGGNSDYLKLALLPTQLCVDAGDRIVTCRDDGRLPRGLSRSGQSYRPDDLPYLNWDFPAKPH